MLQTKAVFNSKDTVIEAADCVIEKVIHMSGAEFDYFSRHLTRDMDFIRDNKLDSSRDAEGRRRCLLVVGEGRRDGILVESGSYDYARHTAFLPNVMDFLTAGQYPALAALNKKLTDVVDYVAEQNGQRYVFSLDRLEEISGINFEFNDVMLNTLLGMLGERPEIKDFEFDNNELIIYREPEIEPAAEDLSDPSITQDDMYALGYGYEHMIPLRTERALELFDKGYEVFRLYRGGFDIAVDSRRDIEVFDGIFGVKDPAWNKGELPNSIEVFIVNREHFESDNIVGEWLSLPSDAETLHSLFRRIEIDRPSEGAFTITAVRVPQEYLRDHVSKYDSLDELNMLASIISELEGFEVDKMEAILTSGVKDIGKGTAAVINALYEENFDAFRMIDASNAESLGKYWARETDEKPDDVSYEQYGYLCIKDEGGVFTEHGYIYFRYKELLPEYDGVVPDEYKIVGEALRGLRSKAPERGGSDEKPSVLDRIKASREAPREPRGRDAQKHKKDKGGPEL